MEPRAHWDRIYVRKTPEEVSWYAPHLATSLRLIERAAATPEAAVIDVGAGQSTLVDDLLDRGFRNLTVLDISSAALEGAQRRLGAAASRVRWVEADIATAHLPAQAYDVWHDRAVFHFLTQPAQRRAYIRLAAASLKPGGHIIVATFAPDGPTQCSGLPVARYDASSLHAEFGPGFRFLDSIREVHTTPQGAAQAFTYCYCATPAS